MMMLMMMMMKMMMEDECGGVGAWGDTAAANLLESLWHCLSLLSSLSSSSSPTPWSSPLPSSEGLGFERESALLLWPLALRPYSGRVEDKKLFFLTIIITRSVEISFGAFYPFETHMGMMIMMLMMMIITGSVCTAFQANGPRQLCPDSFHMGEA